MRSPLIPFLIAAAVTVLIGVGVRMEPYFAGDVRLTRAVQQLTPAPASWATPVSRLAPAPGKYYVMAIALVAAFFVAGWRGLAIVTGFLLLEQYGAEHTNAIFNRPRPSPDLVAVVGSPRGLSFPSTTITFFAVTIGAVEKYLTDKAWEEGWVKPLTAGAERGQSVGVVGAGPAGLAAAERLRELGYGVTVYDRHDRPGGPTAARSRLIHACAD